MSTRHAPGRPGHEPHGITARKQGVGTSASRDTVVRRRERRSGRHLVPSPDRACVRMLRFIVTDGKSFFSDETEHAESHVVRDIAGRVLLPKHVALHGARRRPVG